MLSHTVHQQVIFIPNQRLGILSRSVWAMVAIDISSWLVLLVFCLCTFGLVVFLCYPVQLGSGPPGLVAKFDQPLTSIQALLELALLGLEFDITPFPEPQWTTVFNNDSLAPKVAPRPPSKLSITIICPPHIAFTTRHHTYPHP